PKTPKPHLTITATNKIIKFKYLRTMSNINSSFSDDGHYHAQDDSHIGRRSEEGKVYSLQVEYSDRGKYNYYRGAKISEEDIESETPPGTIGESLDVMSENIESSLHRLHNKKHGTFTYHPKSSGP